MKPSIDKKPQTNKNNILNSLKSLTQAKDLLHYLITQQKISHKDIESYLFTKKQPSKKQDTKKSKLFETCRMRHIAFHLSYNGASYSGYAENVGCDTDNSVEKQLFQALQKTCLIRNRSECNYSRCGRTDKGVSANGQVIALRVRSNIPANACNETGDLLTEESGLLPANSHDSITITNNNGTKSIKEMDYCKILNKVLPCTIQMLGWSAVTLSFSARFSCSSRTYRYFFQTQNYDIPSMKQALGYIVGTHDFRNLCKMNVEQVSNFSRLIHSADVYLFPGMEERQVGYIEICGQAFLWHQIRCIASILFLIGQKLEQPILFQQLLDVSTNPSKPSYTMAKELPLVLHSCHFSNLNLTYSVSNLFGVMHALEEQLDENILLAYRVLDLIRMIGSDTEVLVDDLRQFLCEQHGVILNKKGKISNIESNFETKVEDALQPYEKFLSWKEASSILSHLLPSLSTTSHTNVYIPVMERCRGTTYEEKVSSIGGKRKDKYMENVVSKKKNKEEDAAFYKFMLGQGSTNKS